MSSKGMKTQSGRCPVTSLAGMVKFIAEIFANPGSSLVYASAWRITLRLENTPTADIRTTTERNNNVCRLLAARRGPYQPQIVSALNISQVAAPTVEPKLCGISRPTWVGGVVDDGVRKKRALRRCAVFLEKLSQLWVLCVVCVEHPGDLVGCAA